MYTMRDAVERNLALAEEIAKLKGDLKRFVDINDSLIEDNEAFQKEIERLKAELADERNRHDRLSGFELTESKELTDAKRIAADWKSRFGIVLSVLFFDDYDVADLIHKVALIRAELLREEHHE